MPGYSDKSLAQKLGIKADTRILPVAAPEAYSQLLGELPPGAQLASRAGASVDLAHVFAVREAELRRRLTALRRQLRPDAVVWVSWPKKTANVPTDITEDVIRACALPLGFVDIKVCAVTDVWSGLKLVVRKSLRPTHSDRMP
jgi:hypothetical protein